MKNLFMRMMVPAMLLMAAINARATVSLSLSDGDVTPSAVIVFPGSTFTVTASIISTSEQVTGVDYYLQASGAAAGKLRITSRNTGSSLFSDVIKPNTGDNGANPGITDSNFNLLDPRNALDLGASIANVAVPLNAGTYVLGTYTISVPSNTPAGTYTLSTMSDPGTGWVGGSPFFLESDFNSHGSFSVTVQPTVAPVPEPATGLLTIGLAGIVLGRRRR